MFGLEAPGQLRQWRGSRDKESRPVDRPHFNADVLRKPVSPRLAFSGYYIGQFLFLGVQLPFYAGYLDARGLSPATIGKLVAIALVLRLIFAPIIAFQSEKLTHPRNAMIYASAGLTLSCALALVAPGAAVLSIATIGLLFSFGLIMPLTDAAVLRADRRGELSYGPVRSIGSASFIAANLIGGAVISVTDDRMAIIWMTVAAFIALLLAFKLPKDGANDAPRPKPDFKKALILFRSRSFLYLLFAAAFVQGSHAVYYAFSELSFSAAGYPSWIIGWMWTIGVLAEIVFLAKGKKLMMRLGPTGLLLIGAAGAILRWPLLGLNPPLLILFPVQILHLATYAATYMATVEFVGEAVPEEYRATAMTIIASLGIGAVTGVATMLSGYIFDPVSPFKAYAVMGMMGGAGLILALMLRARWDGGTLHAVKDA
ncbi:hypothetical protein DX908_12850 [Parvularcula marina]|uniref:Major facilitator superfamily associated domain-containing protein n=1 Tax=Parvularcula marina TaxID=2292771 RepID=A0A371RKT9_9PROT|nr:hypothetical protein DX908_12850 [Parvularcula marina]